MKIENLKKGMIIKNYRELCKVLEIPISHGNTKKSQLKEFERFVKFRRSGNSFIIDKLYNKPLEKIDNRKSNNSIYRDNAKILILDLLSRQTQASREINITGVDLFRSLYMVNDNFKEARRDIDKEANNIKVDSSVMKKMVNDIYASLKSTVEGALDDLYDQRLVMWKRQIMVKKLNIEIVDNEFGEPLLDEHGNVVTKSTTEYRAATRDEQNIILKCEREALIHFKCDNISSIIKKGMIDKYSKYTNKLVKQSINIDYYCYAYNLRFYRQHIIQKLDEYILEDKIRVKRLKEMNDTVLEKRIKIIDTKLHDETYILLEREDKDFVDSQFKECMYILSHVITQR